jgi:hypothetical protein
MIRGHAASSTYNPRPAAEARVRVDGPLCRAGCESRSTRGNLDKIMSVAMPASFSSGNGSMPRVDVMSVC